MSAKRLRISRTSAASSEFEFNELTGMSPKRYGVPGLLGSVTASHLAVSPSPLRHASLPGAGPGASESPSAPLLADNLRTPSRSRLIIPNGAPINEATIEPGTPFTQRTASGERTCLYEDLSESRLDRGSLPTVSPAPSESGGTEAATPVIDFVKVNALCLANSPAANATAAGEEAAPANGASSSPLSVLDVHRGNLVEAYATLAPVVASARRRKGRVLGAENELANGYYRFMSQKISEKADAVDRQLERVAGVLCSHHGIKPGDVISAVIPGQTERHVYGRIVAAADDNGASLRGNVVYIESPRHCGGHLIPLGLDKCPSFSFFPGQVVLLRGINLTGTQFDVSQVEPIPPLPPRPLDSAAVETLYPSAGAPGAAASGLKVMISCGPYTPNFDLRFDPLLSFLDAVVEAQPDVAIIIGPILEDTHPLVVSGNMKGTTVDVFADVLYVLTTCAQAQPHIQFILVPALSDVTHPCPVLPQPPFALRRRNIPANLHCHWNPSIIQLGDLTIGLMATDLLMHLSRVEISRQAPDTGSGSVPDRLHRLAEHVLLQRTLYPVLPAQSGTSLELPRLDDLSMGQYQPDILVMPSNLKTFIKNIHGALVINPGRLCTGGSRASAGGGTYARVLVLPPRDEASSGDVKRAANISARCQAEVVRI
ncbi:hypothetical protein H696_01130 [Fonticula alba]|uniref:DNA polymerase alpha subunit B n=1 Tax=Fonticula alba TaxID=691883 RepID=A0A058ZE18_FONAL|nr:hypothetical protein H696_01130 [Fonticula alba]KCV71707.1 hypothetical protein H696_01130 [Fonticula alba]|eukprot:XP_009493285.1 hypothetical protein H696_01130 [Fonticula alba]